MRTIAFPYAILPSGVAVAIATAFLAIGIVLPVVAQVTSDGTINTLINQGGNNFNILNGIEKGNNLFHSFSNFSLPTGTSANFDLTNTPNITTIFSRVTGGNASNIDGLIQTLNANNPVSLFLMNPAGIVFGQNASLNIGGSFVGTTANSIKFADGVEFSAVNPTATPLLTMSVPIGLQLAQNPRAITVQNTGHRLMTTSRTSPFNRSKNPFGLTVSAGKTLALIGGDINLDGGVLTAPSGHIELGSATSGTVNLNTSFPAWNFDYTNTQQLGTIRFSHQALADASGVPAGSIQIQGRSIYLNDGSGALLINEGNQASGNLIVNASESLEAKGIGTYGFPQNILQTDTVSKGAGGNLVVSAPRIFLQDGTRLTARTSSAGIGGNVSVNAADSIQLIGTSSMDLSVGSGIAAVVYSSGNGGNLQITTGRLSIQDAASIVNSNRGTGASGDSTINASEQIIVSGDNQITTSTLGIASFNRGNAGKLTINTPKLFVSDGGAVIASTLGVGTVGTFKINASDEIIVSGKGAISDLPSRIGARAELLPPAFQAAFKLSAFPTGDSGNLIINTSHLQITDGAIVGVDHQGVGKAGNLDINAEMISLNLVGSIAANTKSGEGGSINLQTNTLVMRHGSNVTATAGGTGNGGNITINSPIILGLENSDIIANALQGRGGNIQITTQGIFGLKYRDRAATPKEYRLTSENDITASSEFGVNGTVDINNFGVDPSSSLVELPINLADLSQQIATGCASNQGSRFVATGRGGIPQNPNQQIGSNRTWFDIRDLSAYRKTANTTAPYPETLIQATSWHRNADGKVELVADKSSINMQIPLTCAVVSN